MLIMKRPFCKTINSFMHVSGLCKFTTIRPFISLFESQAVLYLTISAPTRDVKYAEHQRERCVYFVVDWWCYCCRAIEEMKHSNYKKSWARFLWFLWLNVDRVRLELCRLTRLEVIETHTHAVVECLKENCESLGDLQQNCENVAVRFKHNRKI